MLKHEIWMIPKSAKASQVLKSVEEATSSDPTEFGWSLIVDIEHAENALCKNMHKALTGIYGGNSGSLVSSRENSEIYGDLAFAYYSGCDDIMMVMSLAGGGRRVGPHCKVWAKNIITGNKLDMIDAFAIVDRTNILYNFGIILKESCRGDILGADHRKRGYINKGVIDRDTLQGRIDAVYNSLRYHWIESISMPVVSGVSVRDCAMSGLTHVNTLNDVFYDYDVNTGYISKDVAFATASMMNKYKAYKCIRCSRKFTERESGMLNRSGHFICGECAWIGYYRHPQYIDDDISAGVWGSGIKVFPHLKTVIYDYYDHLEFKISADDYSCHLPPDGKVVIPIISDDCDIFISDDCHVVLHVNFSIGEHEGAMHGRITVCRLPVGYRVFVHLEDEDKFFFHGNIRMYEFAEIISLGSMREGEFISMRMLLSSTNDVGDYSKKDSIARVDVENNKNAIKEIKKLYAKALLKGGG